MPAPWPDKASAKRINGGLRPAPPRNALVIDVFQLSSLEPVRPIVDTDAGSHDLLAGAFGRRVADHRHQDADAAHLDAQHAKAVVRLWKVTRSTEPSSSPGPPCLGGVTERAPELLGACCAAASFTAPI